MGLFVTSYRGHKFVHHGGNLDGFSLLIFFLPDDNVGVVVLTNMDGTQLREVLTYNVYDPLLGIPQVAARQLDQLQAGRRGQGVGGGAHPARLDRGAEATAVAADRRSNRPCRCG